MNQDAKPFAWAVVGSPIYDEKCFMTLEEAQAEKNRRNDSSRIVPLGIIPPKPLTKEEQEEHWRAMGNQAHAVRNYEHLYPDFNGSKRDAVWEKDDHRFRLCDGMGDGYVLPDEVYEWWPAGVKF